MPFWRVPSAQLTILVVFGLSYLSACATLYVLRGRGVQIGLPLVAATAVAACAVGFAAFVAAEWRLPSWLGVDFHRAALFASALLGCAALIGSFGYGRRRIIAL